MIDPISRLLDQLEDCLDGGGDIPPRLDRERAREAIEDYISRYQMGKSAA